MWMEATQPFLSFVQGRNSTQCQYSGSMQGFYWRRQKKSMLGVQKSWLSGSSVSAIFLVKTLCPLQPIGVRMWLTDRPNLWVTCLFFCINSNIDVCCVVQYFVNITQRMSTMETCCPLFVCFLFLFHFDCTSTIGFHLDIGWNSFLRGSFTTALQYVHQKQSPQPPSTQRWVRTGWNFNFGWTTPFNEIECNMCVKHNAAHGHSFATTVCTRPRRALFSCQLGLRAHVCSKHARAIV